VRTADDPTLRGAAQVAREDFRNAFSEKAHWPSGSLVFNTRLLPAKRRYRLEGEKYYSPGTFVSPTT